MSDEEMKIGPTCVYKGDESRVLEGEAVLKARADGWKDEPDNHPQPSTETAPEPASDEPEPASTPPVAEAP